MSATIVEKRHDGEPASFVNLGQRKATVTFESKSQDELRVPELGHAAIQWAQEKGLIGASIRTEGFIFAVDKSGAPVDLLKGMPQEGSFRVEYELGSTL